MLEIVRGDASRIDELEPLWLALREHHGSVTPGWSLRDATDSWARRRKNYIDILAEGGSLFLAIEEDELAGMAICEQEQGGSPTWSYPPSFLAIVDFVVYAEHRRKGVGEALMAACEAEARERGVAVLDLMTVAPNQLARDFYERHGFEAAIVNYRKPLT